jgi:hypothetical protein
MIAVVAFLCLFLQEKISYIFLIKSLDKTISHSNQLVQSPPPTDYFVSRRFHVISSKNGCKFDFFSSHQGHVFDAMDLYLQLTIDSEVNSAWSRLTSDNATTSWMSCGYDGNKLVVSKNSSVYLSYLSKSPFSYSDS